MINSFFIFSKLNDEENNLYQSDPPDLLNKNANKKIDITAYKT